MVIHVSRRMLAAAVICLAASFALRSGAIGEQVNISWQTIDKTVAADGENTTREGAATFPTGEKAHITSHIVHNFDRGAGIRGGTLMGP